MLENHQIIRQSVCMTLRMQYHTYYPIGTKRNYPPFQAKRGWFSVDTAKISEYFSLGVCMEGLNTIFKSLYSVELQGPDSIKYILASVLA